MYGRVNWGRAKVFWNLLLGQSAQHGVTCPICLIDRFDVKSFYMKESICVSNLLPNLVYVTANKLTNNQGKLIHDDPVRMPH